MKSVIYRGYVEHQRLEPVRHHFRYPVYGYGLFLEELAELDRRLPFFGYNRLRPVAIHDRDYLTPGRGNIEEKLIDLLRREQTVDRITSILLVTSARYFNHVFNPVSFYYCFGHDGSLEAVVAEVNNTFGERHVYFPKRETDPENPNVPNRYVAEKVFHVSPFNDLRGWYEFFFPVPGKSLAVAINLKKDHKTVFKARLTGQSTPLTSSHLFKTLLKKPMTPHLTLPRILLEAAKLFFFKRMKYHPIPRTDHPMTVIRRERK